MKLRELVKRLEKIRGRHTELVSVYIPVNYNLVEVVNQLVQERATAENIKSKTTRKNVTSALDKIINHLRLFRKTPENGLIIFCGNVSQREGEQDIELWSVEPPEPLTIRLYRCDQKFILDPLKEMLREREVYGLVVLDAGSAEIGLLKGKKIQSLKHLESVVPPKTVKGGMSQARYDRLRAEEIMKFLKKVGEIASRFFLEQLDLKGVLIGGPGPVKEEFAKGDYLNYQIKQKVIGIVDTGYTGEEGLRELVDRGKEKLQEASIFKEKSLLNNFFLHLRKDDGLAIYGINETLRALEMGAIDTLIVSEAYNAKEFTFMCPICGYEEKRIGREKVDVKCQKCGNQMVLKEEEDLIDVLIEKAKNYGTKVEIVSTDTREGAQFKELGGIGGILRYRIE